jgi:hypothetical protein
MPGGQVIEHEQFMTLPSKHLDHMAADIAGAPCYEYLHPILPDK